VAARIVDLLEVVDVDEDQAQAGARAAGVLEATGELLLERAVVAEPGQGVEQRVLSGPSVELGEPVALGIEGADDVEDASGEERHRDRKAGADDEQRDERARLADSQVRPEPLDGGEGHEHGERKEHGEDQAPARHVH
jgi:hypothetical protein